MEGILSWDRGEWHRRSWWAEGFMAGVGGLSGRRQNIAADCFPSRLFIITPRGGLVKHFPKNPF